ncbi:hypothetical protein [Azospirillum sp. SYSU D00513]|uniref:hypothetical protein n=1 Tax=Azospirillum sp. SYSU D00513 TaxID=2812561 RepID=UPI001A975ABA|nr:hypothetical protein [Azospirillum sp. SYSU D00513]
MAGDESKRGDIPTGQPVGATGTSAARDIPEREVPVSDEDRARGVTSQREVNIVGPDKAARESAVLGSGIGTGAGSSSQMGAHGSGSTSNVPGGQPLVEPDGVVGGMQGLGVGGAGPTDSPIGEARVGEAGVRGGGARDERTAQGERGTATDVGGAMSDYQKKRG